MRPPKSYSVGVSEAVYANISRLATELKVSKSAAADIALIAFFNNVDQGMVSELAQQLKALDTQRVEVISAVAAKAFKRGIPNDQKEETRG